MCWTCRGVRGGWSTSRGGPGAFPSKFVFLPRETCHVFRWFFRHMVFANGFLFLVKELGFWSNLGQWVRVLDVVESYMYIVL
jgi:hypothetical protein